jgi:hypothetical protein
MVTGKKELIVKRNIGYLGLGVLTAGVLLFLGKHSLNFFMFTFAGSDELYAWMGLLLTSLGAIIWLWIFKFTDGTRLQKTVALVMMFAALLGEFLTAGFDIYMQAMVKDGFHFTTDDIRNMSIIVSALGLLTGMALIIHFAGDTIIEEFKKDEDGDGIPDFIDPVDNRNVRHLPQPMTDTLPASVAQVRRNGAAEVDPTKAARS